jgi:predicted porin
LEKFAMKKSLIALAALAATTAFAQSSVTISGQLDAGISSTENGSGATKSTATTMGSGIHGASRLRFVGVEDLGGGNKANFWLEMQPNFQTGATSADLFNRGAWLGLQGNWGEVRLGRQGTNTIGAVCTIDQHGCYSGFSGGGILFSGQSAPGTTGGGWMLANPTRGGTQAASTTGSAADSTRYVKAVRYSLPTLVTGLSVNATYAYGTTQTATAAAAGNSSGVDATYANGPLAVVFAYQKAEADAGSTQTGELTTLGATYDLGVVKLGAGAQQEKAAGTAVAFTKGDSYALTATVPMGAFTPYVKYGEHKYSGGILGSVTNAKISNVGVRYALSKRSLVYVDYVNNAAALTSTTTSSKSMASVGIQHNF